jgi:hypothetical protein
MEPPEKAGLSKIHCSLRLVLSRRGICRLLALMGNQGTLRRRFRMLNGTLIPLLLSMRPQQVIAGRHRLKQDRSYLQLPIKTTPFLILPPL